MATPSTPFEYPEFESSQPPAEPAAAIMRQVSFFIRDRILTRTRGKYPPPKTIAVRLLVLHAMLHPDDVPSLAALARDLGCSTAWLSRVARNFSDSMNLRAPWQRPDRVCATYAKRAKGVHAGTWTRTDKAERDRMRRTAKGKT